MRTRLLLLAGQATAHGAMVAFLVVPVSALFLDRYGADRLPWVYLAVAVAGVATSWAMRRAGARVSLAGLALTVLLSYGALVAIGALALGRGDADWVLFPLLVLFPLAIPVGFTLIGAQAGRLLDVRQIKQHLPRVFAGFSVGFAIAGLAAAALVGPLGGAVPLLAVDVVLTAVFVLLVFATGGKHPAELRSRPEPTPAAAPAQDAVDRRRLLRNRLVLALFGYQVLSAAVTQLADYMVWERAAARFPDPEDLARFQGIFAAVINIVGLLFVVLLAGRLLGRYGVGFGLAVNPGSVLVLLGIAIATGLGGGVGGTGFLVALCALQVTDIACTDGATRTSINAAYQALPPDRRFAAQTGVEAAGIPLALGLVGGFLLLAQALDLDVLDIALVTLAVTLVWLALAVWGYREYGAQLRVLLSARPWAPIPLRIRDERQRAAVQRLLDSDDPRDVGVALTALRDSGDPLPTDQPALRGPLPVDLSLADLGDLEARRWGDPDPPVRDVDPTQVRAALDVEAARVRWLLDTLALLRGRDGPEVTSLVRALRDEMATSKRQVLAVLGLAYGHDAVVHAVTALGGGAVAQRGLALEMLEVTVGHANASLAVALVDPTLDDDARLGLLDGHAEGAQDEGLADRLATLLDDPEWDDGWLGVCAVYAAPALLGPDAGSVVRSRLDDPDPVVAETVRWALARLEPPVSG